MLCRVQTLQSVRGSDVQLTTYSGLQECSQTAITAIANPPRYYSHHLKEALGRQAYSAGRPAAWMVMSAAIELTLTQHRSTRIRHT
jgi:hypothetical protein